MIYVVILNIYQSAFHDKRVITSVDKSIASFTLTLNYVSHFDAQPSTNQSLAYIRQPPVGLHQPMDARHVHYVFFAAILVDFIPAWVHYVAPDPHKISWARLGNGKV